jgi:hypothetical protein
MADESIPSYCPTYGISVDHNTVREIVAHSLPRASGSVVIENLPSGASFNNKIIFLETSTDGHAASYVLKLNGRFFGPNKIKNEVSCLALLQRYCPDIPTPRVIAWSTNGTDITVLGNSEQSTIAAAQDTIPGWILMTKLPGESMVPSLLSRDERLSVSTQLADMVSSWRANVPSSDVAGNLGFDRGTGIEVLTDLPLHSAVVGSNIGYGRPSKQPLTSLLAYYQTEIEHQINVMRSNRVFALTRAELLPLLNTFVKDDLCSFSIFDHGQNERFVFTWNDIAPRNILISGQPPKITGIVDFEFSGFFPPMEDFQQEWDEDNVESMEWPQDMYEAFQTRMAERGAETPLSMRSTQNLRSTQNWKEYQRLYMLRDNIAPWWLLQGVDGNSNDHEGVDSDRISIESDDVVKASRIVRTMLLGCTQRQD